MRVPREILENTVGFLYKFDELEAKYKPLGTAFFVHIEEEDFYTIYLVTCKHVVKEHIEIGEIIFLRMNSADERGVEYIALENRWHYPEDETVDLAIMAWLPKQNDPPLSWGSIPYAKAILTDDKLNENGGELRVGDELMFMGLFMQYEGYNRNFPIYRFGSVSLITNEKIRGYYGESDYFLAECQGYPGNSGSPVYIAIQNNNDKEIVFLVGVVAGFWPEREKRIYGEDGFSFFTHIGISAIVPYNKLHDMFMSKIEIEMRKLSIDKKKKETGFTPATAEKGNDDVITKKI